VNGRPTAALLTAALVATGVAACADRPPRPSLSGGPEQATGEDPVAYYQLATTSGFLQASAATGRSGGGRIDPAGAQLPAASARLTRLHPRDSDLRHALALLAPALHRWLSLTGGARRSRSAEGTLGINRRVQVALSRYESRHRGLSGSIPE
jgi:hypothetical protein